VIGLLCSDWSDDSVCCDWSTLLWLVRWPVCLDWSTLLWLVRWFSLLWLVFSALIGQMAKSLPHLNFRSSSGIGHTVIRTVTMAPISPYQF